MGNIHQYVITTSNRDKLQQYLKNLGIPTLIHYPTPIHQQPFFATEYGKKSLPVAEKFCHTTLSLPSHEHLTTDEIEQVIDAIHAFFKKC